MPIVRGRFTPEIEDTGRTKRVFDVLLWGSKWSRQNVEDLDQIEALRDYLNTLHPAICDLRLLVPSLHGPTVEALRYLKLRFTTVEVVDAQAETSLRIVDKELAVAAQTAIACDADALVVTNEG